MNTLSLVSKNPALNSFRKFLSIFLAASNPLRFGMLISRTAISGFKLNVFTALSPAFSLAADFLIPADSSGSLILRHIKS